MKLGSFDIQWLEGGQFELDGGTMFGAVPKVLWSRKAAADAENYILYRNACMLVRTGQSNIIIETGVGNKLSEKQHKIFRIKEPWDLPGSLAALGLRREDIDTVILTHLDFDHAGGISMINDEGVQELTFPNARHIINRIEWHDARHPSIRSSNTYFEQNISDLVRTGQFVEVDGSFVVAPGITLRQTGGHTRGHMIVLLESMGAHAIHMGDLLPSVAHYHPLWIMAYDNYPMDVIEQKQVIEKEALALGAWILLYHDLHHKAVKFGPKGEIIEAEKF